MQKLYRLCVHCLRQHKEEQEEPNELKEQEIEKPNFTVDQSPSCPEISINKSQTMLNLASKSTTSLQSKPKRKKKKSKTSYNRKNSEGHPLEGYVFPRFHHK